MAKRNYLLQNLAEIANNFFALIESLVIESDGSFTATFAIATIA
jgi:hypothetical protein